MEEGRTVAKQMKTRKPAVKILLSSMATMYTQRNTRDRSQPHQIYTAGVKRSTEALRTVIREGSLDDCFAAVKGILLFDLQFLARTEQQKKSLLQHMKNFTDALHNLDAIRTRPDEYRRQAEGYIDDYKIDGLLPKDGMHGALRAYLGHLNARTTYGLTEEEADLLLVQKELAAEIARRYMAIQRGILA